MSKPVGRRDRRPKLRFPGLRARWSEELGWRFRAATQIDGRKVVGPSRETQEEAAQDYREIRSRVEDIPVRVVTLGEALDAVILDAKRRGLPASTYNVQHRGHAKYLLRFWRPETRLSAITESEVIWFVKEARELGRNPNTLIEKDLPLGGQRRDSQDIHDHRRECDSEREWRLQQRLRWRNL